VSSRAAAVQITSARRRPVRDAFICDAVRTPIGRYGGVLATVRADDLAAVPLRALAARNPRVEWDCLDEVVLGCANQAGEDNRNVARMALLLAGLPQTVPGVTVNRLCASGLEAVAAAARAVRTGDVELAIAGGIESMSRAPFVLGKAETAFSRAATLQDTTMGWRFVNPLLQAQYGVDSMPETGENVAEDFDVKRGDQDAFAYRSQMRAARARAEGFLAEEIVPVAVTDRAGRPAEVATDEHPRPDTTLEALARLPTLFRTPGTITAGNASGVNDGAAALVVASEAAVRRHGLVPRARVLGTTAAGVPPRIMGIGPVAAVRKLLSQLGVTLGDFDVVELNEAFASQVLACLRQLGVPDDAEEVNPNGGAIALGHPLGMSGARLVLTAVHHLARGGGRRALVTMCVGVGQGAALALERV
jgi:3-oxoadipyl-CoA thiolase